MAAKSPYTFLIELPNHALYTIVLLLMRIRVKIMTKKKHVIIKLLETRGYDKLQGDDEYKYLRKMPMDSVCEENFQALLQEKGNKEAELNKVKETSIQKMWLRELRTLEKEYEQYKIDRINRSRGVTTKKKKKKAKKTKA